MFEVEIDFLTVFGSFVDNADSQIYDVEKERIIFVAFSLSLGIHS